MLNPCRQEQNNKSSKYTKKLQTNYASAASRISSNASTTKLQTFYKIKQQNKGYINNSPR